jgi:hypothetical protein
MSTKLTALVAGAVLALAGCGGGEKPLTMEEVVAKAGCSDAKPTAGQVGTKEAAICTKGGHDIYLYTFADDTARDNWLKIAKAAGALGSFAQGTSWVAQTL